MLFIKHIVMAEAQSGLLQLNQRECKSGAGETPMVSSSGIMLSTACFAFRSRIFILKTGAGQTCTLKQDTVGIVIRFQKLSGHFQINQTKITKQTVTGKYFT